MSNLPLFYSSVVPIERERDAKRSIVDGSQNLSFAAAVHLIPALVEEVRAACPELVALFAPVGETFSLVFLVGISADQNAFVTKDGKWDGLYAPAYLRRYPFILGEMEGQSFICLDGGFAGSPTEGQRLFDDAGANTPYFDNIVNFVNSYARAANVTDAFIAKLKSLDLLKAVTIQVKPANGEAAVIHGLSTVDEEKLARLPDEAVTELHRLGYLLPIMSIVVSLNGLHVLSEKLSRRASA
jgi:SapC